MKKKAQFVAPDLSRKILSQALEQQREADAEDMVELPGPSGGPVAPLSVHAHSDDEEEDYAVPAGQEFYDVDMDIDEADQRALAMFMNPASTERRSLADIVMAKLREQEELMARGPQSETEDAPKSGLHPKVVQVYTGVGKIMHYYRSGRVPKAFKIIPSLNNWEEVMYLTAPHDWSNQSMFYATRLFSANLNEKMAQRFYNTVLLPRVLDDVSEHKKLNYHLYRALRKALYKPLAFFKGIVIPMCTMNCSLKEATIVASVIAKVSVPVLPASAALLKLCQMTYSGPTSILIKTLLNKKYALPYRVIDGLVVHFHGFVDDKRRLPVLWHQSLLVFVQRYKSDLTREQKEALRAVMRKHTHAGITDEVRRELFSVACRGEAPKLIEDSLMADAN